MCDRRSETQKSTLQQLVTQLRKSSEASARLHGGTTYYAEELAQCKSHPAFKRHFITEPPSEIATPPTAEGNEHQVWFRKASATFIKATWPNNFGMKVIHRNDEDPQASPIDYLERWHLHNHLFGDSVSFIGALQTPDGLRFIIEQPAIEGIVATLDQINDFFTQSGWLPFSVDNEIAYYDPEKTVVVSDTHRGNIISMKDGLLAPIDLRVQRLTPTLEAIVQQLCNR